MGFKRYLLRDDAIYGFTNHWLNFDYYFSTNCTLVTNSVIWTVKFFSLKLDK